MYLANKIAALLLIPIFLFSSPALAQQTRIVDAATMNQALAGKAEAKIGRASCRERVCSTV